MLGQFNHCFCPSKGPSRGYLHVSTAGLPLLGRPGHPRGVRSPRPGCCCCPSGSVAALLSRGWAGRAGAGSRGGRAALWRQRARSLSLQPAGRRNTLTKQIYGMVLFLELLVLKVGKREKALSFQPDLCTINNRSCELFLPVCPLLVRVKEPLPGSRYPSGSMGGREGSYWTKSVWISRGD